LEKIMFPFTLTDRGITVFMDGKPRMFSNTHVSFQKICDAVDSGDDDLVRELVDVKATVAKMSLGRVQIVDNQILVAGRQVTGRLVERILEMVTRGSNAVEGYIKFLDNMMLNPSSTAVKELYLFIEACDLPITADGHFLAYKRVNGDYRDLHSNTFDNSVGTTPTMDRNDVDDNRDNTCSHGLHFCSYDYLPHFGAGDSNKVVVVKINPANVVSIPSDYNNAKGRTWQYEVVDEILDWVNDRITPFFTEDYTSRDGDGFDDEGYDSDGYDYAGYDRDGYDGAGYDGDGYDGAGYDGAGYDRDGYDEDGYDCDGYDCDGYDEDGEDVDGNTRPKPATATGNKLTANEVRYIKNVCLPAYHNGDTTLTAIGKTFNVHRETIARIDRGDIWADVT
jgi:hypothetical protein